MLYVGRSCYIIRPYYETCSALQKSVGGNDAAGDSAEGRGYCFGRGAGRTVDWGAGGGNEDEQERDLCSFRVKEGAATGDGGDGQGHLYPASGGARDGEGARSGAAARDAGELVAVRREGRVFGRMFFLCGVGGVRQPAWRGAESDCGVDAELAARPGT